MNSQNIEMNELRNQNAYNNEENNQDIYKNNTMKSNGKNENDGPGGSENRQIIDKIKMKCYCVYLWFCFKRKKKNIENILLDEGMRVVVENLDIINIFKKIHDAELIGETLRKGENLLPHRIIDLPLHLIDKCYRMLSELGLQYGAFDFILDKSGNYIFLEVNPNGQWAWIECQVGCDISGAIARQLIRGEYEESI